MCNEHFAYKTVRYAYKIRIKILQDIYLFTDATGSMIVCKL